MFLRTLCSRAGWGVTNSFAGLSRSRVLQHVPAALGQLEARFAQQQHTQPAADYDGYGFRGSSRGSSSSSSSSFGTAGFAAGVIFVEIAAAPKCRAADDDDIETLAMDCLPEVRYIVTYGVNVARAAASCAHSCQQQLPMHEGAPGRHSTQLGLCYSRSDMQLYGTLASNLHVTPKRMARSEAMCCSSVGHWHAPPPTCASSPSCQQCNL
jgi:hypothetical protein